MPQTSGVALSLGKKRCAPPSAVDPEGPGLGPVRWGKDAGRDYEWKDIHIYMATLRSPAKSYTFSGLHVKSH